MRGISAVTIACLLTVAVTACGTPPNRVSGPFDREVVEAQPSETRIDWMELVAHNAGRDKRYYGLDTGSSSLPRTEIRYRIDRTSPLYTVTIYDEGEIAAAVTPRTEMDSGVTYTAWNGQTSRSAGSDFNLLLPPDHLEPGMRWRGVMYGNKEVMLTSHAGGTYRTTDGEVRKYLVVESTMEQPSHPNFAAHRGLFFVSETDGIILLEASRRRHGGEFELDSAYLLETVAAIDRWEGAPPAGPRRIDRSRLIGMHRRDNDIVDLYFVARGLWVNGVTNPLLETSSAVLRAELGPDGGMSAPELLGHEEVGRNPREILAVAGTRSDRVVLAVGTRGAETSQDIALFVLGPGGPVRKMLELTGGFSDISGPMMRLDETRYLFTAQSGSVDFGLGGDLRHNGATDILVYRTNASFTPEAIALVGGNWWESPAGIARLDDETSIILGTSGPSAGSNLASDIPGPDYRGSVDILLAAVTDDLEQRWIRRSGTPGRDDALAIAALGNGHFVISAARNAEPGGINRKYAETVVEEYDAAGNLVATWLRSETDLVFVTRMMQSTVDDSLFFLGYVERAETHDVYLARFAGDGTRLWRRTIDTAQTTRGIDMVQREDGTLVIVASSRRPGHPPFGGIGDLVVLEVNAEGELIDR